MNKSNVTSSFRGIWYGLHFLAHFYFSLLLSIGKRSALAKIWGAAASSPPPTPGSTSLYLENNKRKIRIINICECRVLHFISSSYICIFPSLTVKTFVKQSKSDYQKMIGRLKLIVSWLVTLIFMLNTDWMAKKQLNVNSINHFYKQQKKHLKEIRIL